MCRKTEVAQSRSPWTRTKSQRLAAVVMLQDVSRRSRRTTALVCLPLLPQRTRGGIGWRVRSGITPPSHPVTIANVELSSIHSI